MNDLDMMSFHESAQASKVALYKIFPDRWYDNFSARTSYYEDIKENYEKECFCPKQK